MKTALSQLEVVRPRDLVHALKLLNASLGDGRLVPLAGGTDLYVYLHAGTQAGSRFLDLAPLKPLQAIRSGRGGVRIGALATFDAIARHPACAAWPLLPMASRLVGAAQIQNRATIGGNIANASPAGDSLPVLLAYDATIRVASVRGERDVPFADFYTGYRRMAIEPDELIVSVWLPEPPAGTIESLRKVGTRAAQSISKVVFAGVIRRGKGGVVDHARLAWGSVAPTTIRARRAEAAIVGSLLDPAAIERSLAALGEEISPIDDVRSDREYRAEVARALLANYLGTASAPRAR